MSKNRNRNNRSTRVTVKENTDLNTGFGTVGFTDSVSDNYAEGEFRVNFDDNMPQSEPLMLTDGNSTRYGSLVTIEKTQKQKPKKLKVNPEGMRNCSMLIAGFILMGVSTLCKFLFQGAEETNMATGQTSQQVSSLMANTTSMFATMGAVIGAVLVVITVSKIATALVRGEPIDLAPFEWEYITVEKETVKDFYCKSPKELEESDKNREKNGNVTTSMGVIYK